MLLETSALLISFIAFKLLTHTHLAFGQLRLFIFEKKKGFKIDFFLDD
jgi:hypothetical protein